MKQPYNTALYMRLSQDDRNFGDSVSIETQKIVLRQYAHDNGLLVVDEYVDDGWSGTNFDRPAFQRMMEDVESGRINCIVTKDLSRFGREHVMMDYYLEFIFPEKHIRYIAVAENEDTEKGLSDFVGMMNRNMVDAAGMNIDWLAEFFVDDCRTFEMPAGVAGTAEKIPAHGVVLARFDELPNSEVGRIAFFGAIVDAGAGF